MHIKEWLHRHDKSTRWLAKEANISEQYASSIKTGMIIPGRKTAEIIERVTNGDVTAAELRRKPLGWQDSIKQRVKARLHSKFANNN